MEIFEIPSTEEHCPREECEESSFRTDVFIKPPDEKPQHKVRLIYCCPKGKWNAETQRCEDGMKLHKLIREAAPEEIASSSSIEITDMKMKLEELDTKLDELMRTIIERRKPRRERTRYECEELLKKGACALLPDEKKAFVLCYTQKGLKEGTVGSRSEGMKKGWQMIRECTTPK